MLVRVRTKEKRLNQYRKCGVWTIYTTTGKWERPTQSLEKLKQNSKKWVQKNERKMRPLVYKLESWFTHITIPITFHQEEKKNCNELYL